MSTIVLVIVVLLLLGALPTWPSQPILGLRPDRGPEPGPHRADGDGVDRPALTMVPRRRFGRHADEVSILGVGGYHLGRVSTIAEAVRIVHAAIDGGVTFLDNAWEYHEGASEERMGRAIHDRRADVFLMTKVCTHGRDAKVAMRQLEQSLRRLRTDYLDLWQVHECVYYNDPARHFAAGGVIEALDRAKRQGKVRFVGFTGHKDPAIHLEMLSLRLSVRRLPAAAQRLRRPLPQLPAPGAAGAGNGRASPPSA